MRAGGACVVIPAIQKVGGYIMSYRNGKIKDATIVCLNTLAEATAGEASETSMQL